MKKVCFFVPQRHVDGRIGGVTLSISEFLSLLAKEKVTYSLVDTNLSNYKSRPLRIIKIPLIILFAFFSSEHISVHGTANDFKFILPFVFFSLLFSGSPIRIGSSQVILTAYCPHFLPFGAV